MLPAICPARTTAARSPANATRARASTRRGSTCSTPTKARQHLQQQIDHGWCLTLATTGILAWTTEYLRLTVERLRAQGRRVDEKLLAYLSPAYDEHIGLVGTITVDHDAEFAQLDPPTTTPADGDGDPASVNATYLSGWPATTSGAWQARRADAVTPCAPT